jgi:hypothetical protein
MTDCEGERLEIEVEGDDVEVGVEPGVELGVEVEVEVDWLLAVLDAVPVPFDWGVEVSDGAEFEDVDVDEDVDEDIEGEIVGTVEVPTSEDVYIKDAEEEEDEAGASGPGSRPAPASGAASVAAGAFARPGGVAGGPPPG